MIAGCDEMYEIAQKTDNRELLGFLYFYKGETYYVRNEIKLMLTNNYLYQAKQKGRKAIGIGDFKEMEMEWWFHTENTPCRFGRAYKSSWHYIIPSLMTWWSRSTFSITVPWMT